MIPTICRNGACENLEGGYRCICNLGYMVDETGHHCHDINECAIDNLLCDGGQVGCAMLLISALHDGVILRVLHHMITDCGLQFYL